MLHPDVTDLREFYAGALGQTARRLLRTRLRAIWPNVAGQRVLGLGYAIPYLGLFRDEAERVLAAMPAAQGVVRWPANEPSLALLADDLDLPFADMSIERVLLIHALETSDDAHELMREVWRVLTPTGRLLVAVPNRRGLWARFEHTPFGQGHPYTPRQLGRLMRENLFSPTQSEAALFFPPSQRRTLLRAAGAFERAGRRFWPHFGGVVLAEAEKQVYLPVGASKRARERRRAPALQPAPVGRVSSQLLSIDSR
jgi:SAM-dependent methyltransferase